MSIKMMGKKQGMSQHFDSEGNVVACTLIQVDPHSVILVRTKEKEGYNALQLGFEKVEERKEKNMTKPLLGHFKKRGITPCKHIAESRLESVEGFAEGQEIDLSHFTEVSYIDVSSFSKGKGFQGVMKRHGFRGGPAAHGSGFHRHGGSCGMRSTPGRTLPGVKKAGRMGGEKVTVQNLKVLAVDVEKRVIVVKGGLPGPNGALVCFSASKKMKNRKVKQANTKKKK